VSELALDEALFGDVLTPRVQQIIRLEREADDAQWEAARLITEELAAGKSKTQLGREIGKGRTHVLFMSRCWELRDRYYSNGSFSELYNSPEIRAASEKPEPPVEPEPLPLGESEVPESEPTSVADPPLDGGAQDLDRGTSEDLEGEPASPAPPPPQTPPRPSAGTEKLERLQRTADDEERANPEEPVTELLDTQRALRALISKTRPFRSAGLEVNTASAARIDTLYQEWRGLL
jgi:hypothetical protein